MNQATVIIELNAVFPGWRRHLENAQNSTFEALRWKIRSGTLFSDAATREALRAELQALAGRALALSASLDSIEAPASTTARQYVSKKDLHHLARVCDPSHSRSIPGFPPNWAPWMRSQGYENDMDGKGWYKITKT